mmetsp:Transcript_57767/g.162042  ORF Transcript_57767/g.162042 Transcript_57767/m.162042 type:complete len:381 (+) Transcript_57767:359-1501(+)
MQPITDFELYKEASPTSAQAGIEALCAKGSGVLETEGNSTPIPHVMSPGFEAIDEVHLRAMRGTAAGADCEHERIANAHYARLPCCCMSPRNIAASSQAVALAQCSSEAPGQAQMRIERLSTKPGCCERGSRSAPTRPARMSAAFCFFRFFRSPSGQRWQCVQASPPRQPLGLQNQAQGLQPPVACNVEPGLERNFGDPPSSEGRASSSEPLAASSVPAEVSWSERAVATPSARASSFSSALARAGLAATGIAACFALLRAFSSPSGQRWQWPHSFPLWQLPGRQNQAHGWQFPARWRIDPVLGMSSPTVIPGGNSTTAPERLRADTVFITARPSSLSSEAESVGYSAGSAEYETTPATSPETLVAVDCMAPRLSIGAVG